MGSDWKKYPRTPHHPSSMGRGSDDKVAHDLSALQGVEVVVTEKMDGENTTLYRDGFHARSLDSAFHPSRSWLAGFHAGIAHTLPGGWRVAGENLFARHSIAYENLPSYFLAFSVWDDGDNCLDIDQTAAFCAERGIETVPVLWRGRFSDEALAQVVGSLELDRQEGVVVRPASRFHFSEFGTKVVKWVRPQHVQSDQHWSRGPIVQNGLRVRS